MNHIIEGFLEEMEKTAFDPISSSIVAAGMGAGAGMGLRKVMLERVKRLEVARNANFINRLLTRLAGPRGILGRYAGPK